MIVATTIVDVPGVRPGETPPGDGVGVRIGKGDAAPSSPFAYFRVQRFVVRLLRPLLQRVASAGRP